MNIINIFIKFCVKIMVRALYTVSDETVVGQDSAGCDVTDYQLPPEIPFPLSLSFEYRYRHQSLMNSCSYCCYPAMADLKIQ